MEPTIDIARVVLPLIFKMSESLKNTHVFAGFWKHPTEIKTIISWLNVAKMLTIDVARCLSYNTISIAFIHHIYFPDIIVFSLTSSLKNGITGSSIICWKRMKCSFPPDSNVSMQTQLANVHDTALWEWRETEYRGFSALIDNQQMASCSQHIAFQCYSINIYFGESIFCETGLQPNNDDVSWWSIGHTCVMRLWFKP